MTINVIGAGTWGITLASLLSKRSDVLVWQRDNSKAKILNQTKTHPNLNRFKIPDNVKHTGTIEELDFNNITVIALPSHSFNSILSKCDLKNGQYLIASKGFNHDSSLLLSETLENLNVDKNNIAVISGPNHAEEIIEGKASASVIASVNNEYAKKLQSLLSSNTFRVYTSDDIVGVQIGGAIKNIIAIASGLCVGLELGDNTQAALVSRGMNEILNLESVYNLNHKTLYGLSGLGDLIATCYSPYSRNRQLGVLLAQGLKLKDAINQIGMISEGINACKFLNDITKKHNVEMPICNEIYKILFEKSDPSKSLENLMTRDLKDEN